LTIEWFVGSITGTPSEQLSKGLQQPDRRRAQLEDQIEILKAQHNTSQTPRQSKLEGRIDFTTVTGLRGFVAFQLDLPPDDIVMTPALTIRPWLGAVVGYH
jgi:hypothetical protein